MGIIMKIDGLRAELVNGRTEASMEVAPERGNCFLKTGRAILNSTDIKWILVHGVVTGTGGEVYGKRFAHAWLENGGIVYDAEGNTFVIKESYYKVGKIKESETVKYSMEEACKLMLETGNYGPWDSMFNANDLEG